MVNPQETDAAWDRRRLPVHAVEEVADKGGDLLEVGIEEPVPAALLRRLHLAVLDAAAH